MNTPTPTASRQIQEALDTRLAEAASKGHAVGATTVEATTSRGSVSVSVEDIDRLGVLAGPVTARSGEGGPGSIGAQAEKAIRKLNYLQEPLTVVETEAKRGRAVLRSESPRETGSGREYNEAILSGGDSISIRRYRVEPGSRRKTIPANLSRESLGRLADDLIDILQPE